MVLRRPHLRAQGRAWNPDTDIAPRVVAEKACRASWSRGHHTASSYCPWAPSSHCSHSHHHHSRSRPYRWRATSHRAGSRGLQTGGAGCCGMPAPTVPAASDAPAPPGPAGSPRLERRGCEHARSLRLTLPRFAGLKPPEHRHPHVARRMRGEFSSWRMGVTALTSVRGGDLDGAQTGGLAVSCTRMVRDRGTGVAEWADDARSHRGSGCHNVAPACSYQTPAGASCASPASCRAQVRPGMQLECSLRVQPHFASWTRGSLPHCVCQRDWQGRPVLLRGPQGPEPRAPPRSQFVGVVHTHRQ